MLARNLGHDPHIGLKKQDGGAIKVVLSNGKVMSDADSYGREV